MRRVGQARKRDGNEKEIIAGLRKAGVIVLPISGEGVPDLLTWRQGVWLPLEIKRHRPRRSLSDRHGKSLTPAQSLLWGVTRFPIVETLDEALKAVGI